MGTFSDMLTGGMTWDNGFRGPGVPRGTPGWRTTGTGAVVPQTPSAPSGAIQALTDRRDAVRGLLSGYGQTALVNEAHQTGSARGAANEALRRSGLYNTTETDVAQNRISQQSDLNKAAINKNIADTKVAAEQWGTGDIASQLSHEQDVKDNYASILAQGNAANQSQILGLAGQLGGAIIGGLNTGSSSLNFYGGQGGALGGGLGGTGSVNGLGGLGAFA